jgi:hypothetical protein
MRWGKSSFSIVFSTRKWAIFSENSKPTNRRPKAMWHVPRAFLGLFSPFHILV